MSRDILVRTTRSTNTKTQNANSNYLASDDVHRIAMRSPALYQTNTVPQIERKVGFFGESAEDES
jgi:hypothetical protein